MTDAKWPGRLEDVKAVMWLVASYLVCLAGLVAVSACTILLVRWGTGMPVDIKALVLAFLFAPLLTGFAFHALSDTRIHPRSVGHFGWALIVLSTSSGLLVLFYASGIRAVDTLIYFASAFVKVAIGLTILGVVSAALLATGARLADRVTGRR